MASVEYKKLSPKETVGGTNDEYDDDYMFIQSQHLIADDDKLYVAMMLNRNFRVVNVSDQKSVVDAPITEQVKLAAGMCFHGDDEILVADLNGDKVVTCKKADYTFVKEAGVKFDKPNSLTVDHDGNVIVGEVGDSGKQVRCFDDKWAEKYAIKKVCNDDLSGVNYVSYDMANQRVIITDTDKNAVHVFSSEGSHVFSINKNGEDDGQLSNPGGTTVDQCGNILVCDTGNNRVQVFDKDGKFVSRFGEEDLFMTPLDIYMKPNKEIAVLDGSVMSGWSRVQVFAY